MNTLLESASQIYAFVFFGGITVVALLEWALPRRRASASLGLRWFGNFSLTMLGMVLVRALLGLSYSARLYAPRARARAVQRCFRAGLARARRDDPHA